MKIQQWINYIIAFIVVAALVWALVAFFNNTPAKKSEESGHDHSGHGHIEEEHVEGFKRGPHRGRLLEEKGFQVEVTVYEPEGIPPRFRIYFYEDGKLLNPDEVQFNMTLKRINKTEKIPFKQEGEFLDSTVEATEPHSFEVMIKASYKDKQYRWVYDTFEGRVELSPEAVKNNKIGIDTAGPAELLIELEVMGKIIPNEDATVYISPRFPGIVKAVYKKLGDYVRKGEVLAIIESNESLQNYEVKSEMEGMIIKKNINLGMFLSGQENIYLISDLSTVWADFSIYRQDLSTLTLGDPIEVTSLDGSLKQHSQIDYISPLGSESTQSVIARAVLPNKKGLWKPGLFISGAITTSRVPVEVAVKDSALQTFRDWDVVFINVGNLFEIVPVQIGRKSKELVEIVSGLEAGTKYASENSFILKADLEKSGAKHEH